jgi:adenylate cyclase
MFREFHALLAEQIFVHNGNIDKYMDDAMIGTFGIPNPGPKDVANTSACARAMLDVVGDWNEKRVTQGKPKIRLSIGLHFGPVVTGDIGDKRRLEFTVIGDTIIVESRLEQLTRDLDVGLVASDSVVSTAHRIREPDDSIFAELMSAPPQSIRGREANLDVWTLPTA